MTNGAVDDDSKRGANEDFIVLTTEHRVLPVSQWIAQYVLPET